MELKVKMTIHFYLFFYYFLALKDIIKAEVALLTKGEWTPIAKPNPWKIGKTAIIFCLQLLFEKIQVFYDIGKQYC